MRVRTSEVVKELGIDAEWYCVDGLEPELSSTRFEELIPQLRSGGPRSKLIAGNTLYRHQFETLKLLEEGNNVILVSGTGSGKTEAWVLYAIRSRVKSLAIYPTLALSSDQLCRIKDYYESVGLKNAVVAVDAKECSRVGRGLIKERLSKALIVVTNPAFLLQDIKRIARSPSKSILLPFLNNVELVIIDELDFYGSHGSSLILTLIEIICKHVSNSRPQVVILTATLGNPEELSRYLTSITGRETKVVKGKPRRLKNCTYLILGKNLEFIRKQVLKAIRNTSIYLRYRDIIENPDSFKRNAHILIEELRRQGIKVPKPYFDVSELLARYVDDDVVTLVFTPSIRYADRLASRIKAKLDPLSRGKVAIHHHLIPKNKRKEIEEAARRLPPSIPVIITVRTLLQGVDLPGVGRIVHVGLPNEVREFLQREGRKGRRKELVETETIIVPTHRWDREVVVKGREGIKYFADLPLEKVYVLSNNKYAILLKALFKVMAQVELSEDEEKLAEELGLINRFEGKIVLNDKGVKVWQHLNFYEFGPPYGIRRSLISAKGEIVKELEEASHRDLVEKYQAGTIDYSEDSFVVRAGVDGVKEVSISDSLSNKSLMPEWFNEAVSRYESIKLRWGEKPDLITDLALGKVMPEVQVALNLPSKGFGLMIEQPVGVLWVIESRTRYRVVRIGDSLMQLYDKAVLNIDSPVSGMYRDYTYGFIRVLDPGSKYELVKVAAAMLRLMLRLHHKYLISTRELRIDVYRPRLGLIAVAVWEPEASGILEILDWGVIIRDLKGLREPPLWIQLLDMIDSDARDEVLREGISWEEAKRLAIDLAMQLGHLQVIDLMGYKAVIPKPSRDLKLLSAEIISLGGGKFLVGKYDGEEFSINVIEERGVPVKVKDWLIKLMELALDNNLVVLSSATKLEDYAFSRSASILLNELINRNLLVNPLNKLKDALGTRMLSVDSLLGESGIRYLIRALRNAGRSDSVGKEVEREAVELLKLLLKADFTAYLILKYGVS